MIKNAFLTSLLGATLLVPSPALAEFPPDTFPDEVDSSTPQGGQGSYEEQERREADREYLNPRKRRQKARKRVRPRPSVRKEPLREDLEDEIERARGPWLVGLQLGLSQFSSQNAASNTDIQNIFLKDQFLLGGTVDFSFARLFGVELEAFHATTPVQEIEFAGGEVETRKISQLSVMGGVRVEWPVALGKTEFRPYIGGGFGIHSLNQTSELVAGFVDDGVSVSGFYATLGLKATFGPSVQAFADYAMGLGASGGYVRTGASGDAEEVSNGAGFSRLRVAAQYRLFRFLHVGPMLSIRSVDANIAPRTNLLVGNGDTMLQILALASAEF